MLSAESITQLANVQSVVWLIKLIYPKELWLMSELYFYYTVDSRYLDLAYLE